MDNQLIQNPDYRQIVALAVTVFFASFFVYLFLPSDIEAAADFSVQVPEQCVEGWQGKELDEPSIKISGTSAVQCYCPATSQLLGLINPLTPEGIDRAIIKAQEAQPQWARTSFIQRRRVLKTLLKFVIANQDVIATAACLDSGKTKIDAIFGEILVTAEKIKWTLDHGETALKPERRPTNLLMFYKTNEVRWEPLGVIGACVSWNYPFHNLLGPIISALFSGNTIVVKVSENTAWSSVYFTSIVREALTVCGHSPNVVQTVVCWPQVASYFCAHPGLAHLTFIGSRPVAFHVAAAAAKSLTPVCLELGGKDAAIILDNLVLSDYDRAISILLRGVFQAAGQNCIGIERIIACPVAYPLIVKRVTPLIRALCVGSTLHLKDPKDPVPDVGACVSPANFANLESLITDAVSQGAKLLVGGRQHTNPDFPKGHYFAPTLLIDVTPDMRIAQTELFAPIFLMMRATNTRHAVDLANGTPYALGASVFGDAGSDVMRRVVADVRVGMVAVNDFGAYYAVQLPFGGVKGSGHGRFAGEEGLRAICNTKAVCADRWPWLIKTMIPSTLGLPGKVEAGKAWALGRALVEIGYGGVVGLRWQGIRRVIGL